MREKNKVDETKFALGRYALERILDIIKAVEDEVRRETAKTIFKEIEFAGIGKNRRFLPGIDGFIINLKDWKKLKEKWLK